MSRRRRPHVLEFGLRWPPDTFLARKLEGLVENGFRVTVITSTRPLDASVVMPGVSVLPVVPHTRLRRRDALRMLRALAGAALGSPRRALAAARAARLPTAAGRRIDRREAGGRLLAFATAIRVDPDILHFEWATAAVNYSPLVEALDRPTVVSLRGADVNVYPHVPTTREFALGLPVVLRRADAIHCVADAVAAEALQLADERTKIQVIRPAVDVSVFRQVADRRRDPSSFRIVSVGWLHWRKGHEDALTAVARLVRDGVPVVLDLVGREPTPEMATPDDRERIEHAIRDLALDAHVRLRGWLEPEQLRRLLAEADVLLHASLTEGIPNVVLEAMACGLPVVVTDAGGTREAVDDGIEGFVVPPADPRALHAPLAKLWADPGLRERMGAAGRARVEAAFSLDAQAEQWGQLYGRLLRAPERGRTAGKPLRLADVGLRWPPEPYVERQLRALAEHGVDVQVASSLPPHARPRPIPGLRLVRLPHWRESRGRLVLALVADCIALVARDPGGALRLARACRALERLPPATLRLYVRLARLKCDVLRFEWLSFAALCTPLFEVWRQPVVLACHGSETEAYPYMLDRGRLAPMLPALFARAAAVQCVSEAVVDASRRFGLQDDRARLIRPAVDVRVFRPPAAPRRAGDAFRIVSVGWLRWLKGYEYALVAVQQLAGEGIDVRYDVVGAEPPSEVAEPEERARILETISDLGLDRTVLLHGWLEAEELRHLLQRSDVLLHASLSEGIPNVVLEAMACELPVVATDVGGTREAVRDGVEGYLVEPRDPRALADRLRELWADPRLRARLGAAGRVRAESEFAFDDRVTAFLALYRELAALPRP